MEREEEEAKREAMEEKLKLEENNQREEDLEIIVERRDIIKNSVHKEHLEDLFDINFTYLEKIRKGESESSRYSKYCAGVKERQELFYEVITHPFTEAQINHILNKMTLIWMPTQQKYRKHNDFMWKVMLPEACIKFYMDMFSVSREEAVNCINNTPFEDEEMFPDNNIFIP